MIIATAYIDYWFDEAFQQDRLFVSQARKGTRVDIMDDASLTSGVRITVGVEARSPQVVVTPVTYEQYCKLAGVQKGTTFVDVYPDFGRDIYVSWRSLHAMYDESIKATQDVTIGEDEYEDIMSDESSSMESE
jgi:hypothetical protein